MSLQRFRKIPFACSYLPGKSNLSGPKAGLGACLLLLGLSLAASIERWSMDKAARYMRSENDLWSPTKSRGLGGLSAELRIPVSKGVLQFVVEDFRSRL
jgi:hypothetical protein